MVKLVDARGTSGGSVPASARYALMVKFRQEAPYGSKPGSGSYTMRSIMVEFVELQGVAIANLRESHLMVVTPLAGIERL